MAVVLVVYQYYWHHVFHDMYYMSCVICTTAGKGASRITSTSSTGSHL